MLPLWMGTKAALHDVHWLAALQEAQLEGQSEQMSPLRYFPMAQLVHVLTFEARQRAQLELAAQGTQLWMRLDAKYLFEEMA